jgi:hypothetical protein
MNNYEIASEITAKIVGHFKDNLCGVLLCESSISAKKKPNVIDLIVILNEREVESDLVFFREGIDKYGKEIDLQIFNSIDIRSKRFSHVSHGEFFIYFLKSAKVLSGKNPFLDVHIDYSTQVASVLLKLRNDYFDAQKIQINAPVKMDSNTYQDHRERLLLMLSGLNPVFTGTFTVLESKEHIEHISRALGLTLDSAELSFLLGGDEHLPWEHIFNLYQKLYFTSIDLLEPEVKIKDGAIGDIFTKTYTLSKPSSKLAIIASGCPSDYDESEMALFLNIRGYDVVTFHYSATGVSRGTHFVSPTLDLSSVVGFYKDKYSDQIIISNSYGGFPSLEAADSFEHIRKIIAVSPVFNFLKLHSYATLPTYLTTQRKNEYRFDATDMLDFMEKTQLAPIKNPEKIKIIHGAYDDQIMIGDIEDFCTVNGIELEVLPIGHMSLNKITRVGLSAMSSVL